MSRHDLARGSHAAVEVLVNTVVIGQDIGQYFSTGFGFGVVQVISGCVYVRERGQTDQAVVVQDLLTVSDLIKA
jgi:hypothetical protein